MIPHERSLVEKFDGRPFALLGINSDRDKDEYRAKAEEMGVTWRSSWQGSTGGPIPTQWGVTGWPTLYLVDHNGVIQVTDRAILRNEELLEQAIEDLVEAAEGAADGEAQGPVDQQELGEHPFGEREAVPSVWRYRGEGEWTKDTAPEDTFDSVSEELKSAIQVWRRVPREERGVAPQLEFYPRFEALAEAGDGPSMLWIVRSMRMFGDLDLDAGAVLKRWASALTSDHAGAEWLGPLAGVLGRERNLPSWEREELLRGWLQEGEHPSNATIVRYNLGQVLLAAKSEETTAEAIALYTKLVEAYPEDQWALRAKGDVFRTTRLQVGMTAPDFETEDVDGVAFKLTDYRGKVVLLDFWGFW